MNLPIRMMLRPFSFRVTPRGQNLRCERQTVAPTPQSVMQPANKSKAAMTGRIDDRIRGGVFGWFRFILLILWLTITVGLLLRNTNDRLLFFFLNTYVGRASKVFWDIYLLLMPVTLVVAAFTRNLKRAMVSAGVLLVGFAVILWIGPVDDRMVFRSKLSAYREFLAGAAAGRCSREEAAKFGIPLDGLACEKPMLLVFPWDGFMSAWRGMIYDESDEIAKLPRDRSAAWKSREAARLLSCVGVDPGAAMGNHYYIANGYFAC